MMPPTQIDPFKFTKSTAHLCSILCQVFSRGSKFCRTAYESGGPKNRRVHRSSIYSQQSSLEFSAHGSYFDQVPDSSGLISMGRNLLSSHNQVQMHEGSSKTIESEQTSSISSFRKAEKSGKNFFFLLRYKIFLPCQSAFPQTGCTQPSKYSSTNPEVPSKRPSTQVRPWHLNDLQYREGFEDWNVFFPHPPHSREWAPGLDQTGRRHPVLRFAWGASEIQRGIQLTDFPGKTVLV